MQLRFHLARATNYSLLKPTATAICSAFYSTPKKMRTNTFRPCGKRAELLRQREMENVYLRGIGKDPNGIFVRLAGASSDAFTIGFYRDLSHYAEPNSVSDEEAERAALEAGFEGRAFIGSYLRSLLLRHHDTLGVEIP